MHEAWWPNSWRRWSDWSRPECCGNRQLPLIAGIGGPDDIYTMEYEEWLAANLMKSGLRREARPLLVVHICDVRLRTLGAGNEATIRAQRRLEVLMGGASGR